MPEQQSVLPFLNIEDAIRELERLGFKATRDSLKSAMDENQIAWSWFGKRKVIRRDSLEKYARECHSKADTYVGKKTTGGENE